MEDELELVHLLRSVTVELDLLAAEFAGTHRLHPTDLRALIALLDADRAGETATPGRLGEWLGLNSASVTALIDRLERLGHVRRERDPDDRRRVKLVVEERAIVLGWSFFGPLIGEVVDRMRSYDDSERRAIRRFLLDMDSLVSGQRQARSG
ncbi:MarR family transcriptional regulator [Saccharopolyspora spinosa]|uniref:Transcriptional regulator n=1 Tax=Saccharopolyspora spinosa TaxID=60894 RepID=A0A2N3Y3J7_SACSN|nr:MarR family transcriptional regulator [Saccharopolyspora spinosa]PKW17482.1 transcriptional regulator [Saccharopolyspora spinosa]